MSHGWAAQLGWRYCAMCLLGISALLPYSALLTAQPFFDMHAFAGLNFPFSSMLVYSLCLCCSQLLLTLKGQLLPIRLRMNAAFAISILGCSLLLVLAVASQFINDNARTLACAITLVCVAVLAMSAALLQTALLGMAGLMGPQYAAAVMLGFGIAGLVCFALSLLVQAVEQAVGGVREESGEAGVIVTAVLFSVTTVYTVLCVGISSSLLRSSAMADVEDDNSIAPLETSCNFEGRRALNASSFNASNGLQSMRDVAPQALNVCAVFAVTMCVFPGVMARWEPRPSSVFLDKRQLFETLLVGTFQVFDVLGRTAAKQGAQKITPERLRLHVALRVIFVPAFLLGQFKPDLCVLWGSDVGRFALCAGLALTNGWSGSLAMMFGPMRAADERREVAGMAMSFVMVFGIFMGSLLALATQAGVKGA